MADRFRILPAAFAAGLALVPALAFAQSRDGTAANPPSGAAGRPADRVTGQPTGPEGTGNNPPGTAVGRALERAGDAIGSAVGSAPAQQVPAAMTNEVRPSSRASRIIGAKVYNERGESIGEVEELLIQRDGAASVAVISVGGFLGIGARLVGVPLAELRFAEADSRWMLAGATKESLQTRPVVTYATRG